MSWTRRSYYYSLTSDQRHDYTFLRQKFSLQSRHAEFLNRAATVRRLGLYDKARYWVEVAIRYRTRITKEAV